MAKKKTKKELEKELKEIEQDNWLSVSFAIAHSVQDIYKWASDEVIKELNKLYFKNEGDLTRSDIYRKLKLENIFNQLNDKMQKQTSVILSQTIRTTDKELQGAVGVNWNFYTKEEVEAIANRNYQGSNFSKRIWKNTRLLSDRIKKDITRLVITGASPNKIITEIQNDFGVSYNQASRLVRTEASRVFNDSAMLRYEKLGIEEFEVLVQEDGKQCTECEQMRGKVYKKIVVPRLPQHPNCRCTLMPVLKLTKGQNEL